MNCNCNNKNNSMKEAKIKHVFGNVLRIAIPLTLRTVELVDVDVDGEIEQQAQVTDTDFIPSSDYPVNVVFNKGAVKVSLKAQMRDGNIAYVEDKGKISVGTYDITVTCNDNEGNPYRFKQNTILQVVDATEDAGIETPIEYEVTTWYLDAAIYLVMKGEDGVGIEDIITESSGEIGGVNTITFVLTNGETRSFTILNGSGSVDSDFDENSLHPLSNSVITNKFKSIDANIFGLFGDVDYDSSSKILRFWDITKSTILATIDARPFVKDGMVNRVYIQNRTLVITFNTDSGHDTIAISLDRVFNPNNYYTRSQIDNRFEDVKDLLSLFVPVTSRNGSFSSTIDFGAIRNAIVEDNREVIVCVNGKTYYNLYDVGDEKVRFFNIWYESEEDQFYNLLSVNSDNEWSIEELPFGTGGSGSGSGGYEPPIGGIPKADLAPAVQASLGKADTALQSSDLDGYATTDDVDDAVAALVSSAPQTLDTLKELADALGDDPNFATTMATQLGNKVDKETGKGLSTNDYTTAEKTKLAGLENYDGSALQTAIDGKVDKESGKSLMTDAERTKLQGIAAGAEVNVQPNWTQTNTSADDYIKNKPTKVSDFTNDSGFTSNAGTITGITMNGASKGTSGVVDLGTVITAHQDISGKANASDVYSKTQTDTLLAGKQNTLTFDSTPTANSTNPVISGGIKTYVDGKASITGITTSQDGTFTIAQSDGNSYTVNLNHTHENMAKLVKCTEATLPQTLADDTIYVQVDNLTTPTEIEKLYLFGLEFTGGGIPDTGEPMISSPSNGSTINLGTNEGSGVSKTITIKGKNLTGDLTVTVGTGLTISYGQSTGQSSVTIPMAQALLGAQVTIAYSGTGALDDGSLVISHGGSVLSSVVVVVVVVPVPVALTAIKLSGTQWLQTDYYPNPNTEFELDCLFEANANTDTVGGASANLSPYFLTCEHESDNRFNFQTGGVEAAGQHAAYRIACYNNTLSTRTEINFTHNYSNFVNRSILYYKKSGSNMNLTFQGVSASPAAPLKGNTMQSKLAIGYSYYFQKMFTRFNLSIYGFKIIENGTVVRNYVPAELNGVPGLHDTITDSFISSQTAADVIPIS